MSVFKEIYKEALTNYNRKVHEERVQTDFAFYQILKNIVINSFIWELPDHIYFNRPEMYMYYRGLMGAFIDDGKFKIYPAVPVGALREDGFYTQYQMNAFNGKVFIRDFDDIELLHNDDYDTPNAIIVDEFMENITKTLTTVKAMLKRAGDLPILNAPTEQAIKEILDAYDKKEKGYPFVLTLNNTLVGNEVTRTVLFDNRESDILSIWDIYDKFKHEFYTFYGINNTEVEKRERLTNDEVNSNNEVIQCGYFDALNRYRQDFVNRCNNKELFKPYLEKPISCKKNRIEHIEKSIIENKEGVVNDESLENIGSPNPDVSE